jgi:Bacterial Ig domain
MSAQGRALRWAGCIMVLLAVQMIAGTAAAGASPRPPVNVTPPSISGSAQDGQTLSANKGTWNAAGVVWFSYRWRRCDSTGANCSDIAGATRSTYKLSPADIGTTVVVTVTASTLFGSSTASSGPTAVIVAIPPSPAAAPTISGIAEDGQTLTATQGGWVGDPPSAYDYQWQSCDGTGSCSNLGQDTSTYQLQSSDVGSTVQLVVTASNSGGSASQATAPTAVVQAAPPSNPSPPSISGTPQAGATLTADPGSWSGTPPISYSYRWQNCDPAGANCWSIAGATGASYVVGAWQAGETVRVLVTASNAVGAVSAPAATTSAVAGSGADPAPTYFPASFFSQPIPADAPLDPQSAQMSTQLMDMAMGAAPNVTYNCRRSTYLGRAPGQGGPSAWTDSEANYCHQTNYRGDVQIASDTPTVYPVGADQPDVTVVIPGNNVNVQAAFQAVPIPANARPSGGSDGQMIIWQPSSDTEWEFWQAYLDSTGQWHAGVGGRIQHVSTDPGHYRQVPNTNQACSTNPLVKYCELVWGGTSAHIPNLPGLMTLAQLQSGEVNHGLVMALPSDLGAAWSWPAQGTDGSGNSIIPQGARLRLDPNLNIDAYFASLTNPDGSPRPIAPIERIIARTLQMYGAVVVNTSGSVSFYSENWVPSGDDIFDGPGGLFGGMKPYQFMPDLPWDNMQALQANMCYQVTPGSGLYQTVCSKPPQYVTPDPNAPAGKCAKVLVTSPQPGYSTPPTLTITSPTWFNIGPRVHFDAAASDPTGVTEVDFLVDGHLRYASTSPICAMNRTQYATGGGNGFWDAESEPWGDHTLEVDAYDPEGNKGVATEVVHTGP